MYTGRGVKRNLYLYDDYPILTVSRCVAGVT